MHANSGGINQKRYRLNKLVAQHCSAGRKKRMGEILIGSRLACVFLRGRGSHRPRPLVGFCRSNWGMAVPLPASKCSKSWCVAVFLNAKTVN